ncbi:3-phosphoinositide-dependent protein kinase 1 [Acipenser ruthenus]|uniref:3-phosphoinositide-dependent protein kinase 1 n=1 Tax=Acipenser ruthenus TaxID=7906 RepID=A0A444UBG0_ACIRT|nr:3-phosphoinositide-dependent protein kinase 1 [Acipenser ruthenus]
MIKCGKLYDAVPIQSSVVICSCPSPSMVRNQSDSRSPLAIAGVSSSSHSHSHGPTMEGTAAETRSTSQTSEQSSEQRQQSIRQLAQPRKKRPEDFRFGKILGEGSFSTVVLAREQSTGKEYANFGLSYAKNGELLKYIRKIGSFDETCTRFYAAEIVCALEYLHQKGIIHRDLKPENILLNEEMHIQITDFGTAKQLSSDSKQARANSFVGTAQYVSPELLTEKSACKRNEYLIFQKIIKLEYEFPEKFFPKAKDLVEQLLYDDLLSQFGSMQVAQSSSAQSLAVPECEPPKRSSSNIEQYIHDLDNNSFELDLQFSDEEKQLLLEKQTGGNQWHQFVENNLILKMGPVDKRKGLFARRRQLLLTEGPHLYYVDPVSKVLKGEIPWSPELRPEAKNFKTFFVHTSRSRSVTERRKEAVHHNGLDHKCFNIRLGRLSSEFFSSSLSNNGLFRVALLVLRAFVAASHAYRRVRVKVLLSCTSALHYCYRIEKDSACVFNSFTKRSVNESTRTHHRTMYSSSPVTGVSLFSVTF